MSWHAIHKLMIKQDSQINNNSSQRPQNKKIIFSINQAPIYGQNLRSKKVVIEKY